MLINLVKVLVTLALLAAIAFSVDLRDVGSALTAVHWGDMGMAIAVCQAGILARSWRWQALLESQGVHVSFGRLVNLYYVGTFFNNFLPSGFGGEMVRVYELSRHTTSGAVAISTVLMERMMGLAVLFVMAFLALPFSWRLVPISLVLILLAIIVGFALAMWLILNRAIAGWLAARISPLKSVLANEKAAALYDSFHYYTHAALLKSAGASLIVNITQIVAQVYLASAVGASVSLAYFLLFVPILSVLRAIPISIGGFGVREGGYLLLFAQAGVTSGQSVAMSLLFYMLNALTGLLGGLLYLWQSMKGLILPTTSAPIRSNPAALCRSDSHAEGDLWP